MNRRFFIFAAIATVSALASPSVCSADTPVSITSTYKVGDVEAFKIELHVSIPMGEVSVVSSAKRTIKNVKDNGDVVSEVVSGKSTITINGSEMEQPAPPPVTATHDKLGKLLDVKQDSPEQSFFTPDVARLTEVIQSAILPDKPVATNDTWSVELDNPVLKGKKITLKSTYLGTEKVDATDYWKIKQTSSAAIDDTGGKTTGDVTFWLDPANGRVFKSEGSVKGVPTTQGITVDWTMKRSLDKTDKKAA